MFIYLYHIQPFFIIFTPHIFFITLIIRPPPQTITFAKFVDFLLKYILKHLSVFLKKGSTLITIKIGFGQQTSILTLALIVTTFIATIAIVKYLLGVWYIKMRSENMTFALFVELKRLLEYIY